MKHLNVFPEIPEMFNQIFRISNINQNCCQWKAGLLAQDFWVIKTDLLVVKRCYFPEFHCGRAGEGTAHGSCGFYRYPVIISKISRCTLRFYSTREKCQGEVLKGTQGIHVVLAEPEHFWYMCLQMSSGNPSLNLSIWKVFSGAAGSSEIPLLRAVKGWTLSTAFSAWE